MKCPECVKEGKKSSVFDKGSSTTLMGGSSYYDEDGEYHNHDPNTITWSYSCSNGHKFSVKGKHKCVSCDYGKE